MMSVPLHAAMRVDDIRQHYLPDEYQTVLVGDEDMPVFVGEPTTTLTRGIAIIFTDAGYQGLTLENALLLAGQLNQWGWHTRVLPSSVVTAPAVTATTPETEQEQSASETVTTDALMHPRAWAGTNIADSASNQATIALLASAVLRDVEAIPGFRLVIGQGMSAAQLISLTADETLQPPDAMVVISPYWPQKDVNQAIAGQLAETSFPVLDLSLAVTTQWTKTAASQRKQAATKALKLHYRQKQLGSALTLISSQGDNGFSHHLSREIYGWVNYLGW